MSRMPHRRCQNRNVIMHSLTPFVALMLLVATACRGFDTAQLQDVARVLAGGSGPDATTVDSGLREALRIGTERAVTRTSALGGFLDNPALRIPLPEKLEDVAKALRTIGLNRQVDEFEIAMNRAAERATGQAVEVFWNAISAMTLEDVFAILDGGNTAATDYFRTRTEDDLLARFRPIVENKMREVNVYRQYESLMARYERIPLMSKPSLDLPDYISGEALDGLYRTLGEEEQRIREDPVARTTELLREVFGAQRD